MSAGNEETLSTVADEPGMDVGTAGHQVAVVNEELLRDSETAAVVESRSNDALFAVADTSEPLLTTVSSGTLSSSQGLQDFLGQPKHRT